MSVSAETRVALVEKFYSVQGEGYNAGRSAIFIRLAGCNLACDFAGDGSALCDTPWMETNEKITLDELYDWLDEQIVKRLGTGWEHPQNKKFAPMVIFTGGEPTMHPYFDDLVDLTANQLGLYTAVETNGTTYQIGLLSCDWICVSPKEQVPQGNDFHGDPLADPELDPQVKELMLDRTERSSKLGEKGGEYRYVIGGRDHPKPPLYPADRHYLSPAVCSDGSGTLHYDGFPGFAEGAVERCREIIDADPRWRLSLQTHKFVGAR